MTQTTLPFIDLPRSPASVRQIEAQTKQVRRELARASDPDTSREAGENVDVTTLVDRFMRSARILQATYGDFTAREVAEHACSHGGEVESIRKRYIDAQREQRIELTNTKRPCRATGKVCRTFRISTRKEIE